MKTFIISAGTLALLGVSALAQSATRPSAGDQLDRSLDSSRQRAADRADESIDRAQRDFETQRDEFSDRSERDLDRTERDLREQDRMSDQDLRDQDRALRGRDRDLRDSERMSGRDRDRDFERDSAWDSRQRDSAAYGERDGAWHARGEGGTYSSQYGSGPCADTSGSAAIYGTHGSYGYNTTGYDLGALTYDEHTARSADNPGFVPYGPSSGQYMTSGVAIYDASGTGERARFQVEGRIVKRIHLQDASIPEGREEVLFVIETDQGERKTINAGLQRELAELDLREGDTIKLHGAGFQRDAAGHLVASALEFQGERIALDTPWQGGEGRGARRLQGEVLATREETINGERHKVLRLRVDDGGTEVIDLGPAEDLRGIDLREGDQVQLRAYRSPAAGRDRLMASQLRVNGRSIDLGGREEMRLRGQPVSPRERGMQRESQHDRDLQRSERMGRGRQGQGEQARVRPGEAMEIAAEGMKFYPSRIIAQPGERVRIRLINRAQGAEARHSIEFELPNRQAELAQPLGAGEVGTLEFTAPDRPGTYKFYCPVGDHEERGMTGQLIVQERGQQDSGEESGRQGQGPRDRSDQQQDSAGQRSQQQDSLRSYQE